MTSLWRKQLQKGADVLFNIPADTEFWNEQMLEPLTFAVVCPMLSRFPWKVECWDGLDKWTEELSNMWKNDSAIIRNHLCKLWSETVA